MSFIIALADKSRVVVKCDGLVYEDSTGILCEKNQEMMLSFNENCIIGYNGVYTSCHRIIEEYKTLAKGAGVDISHLKPTTVIHDLSELAKAVNKEGDSLAFLVGGKEEGKIVLAGFVSDEDYEVRNFSPEDNKSVKYINFGSEEQKKALPFTRFYKGGVTSFEAAMNGYIRYLTNLDSSVNDSIFTRKIRL